METERVAYISPSELAAKLKISPNTVGRAARRAGVGIYTYGGKRLAAVHPSEVEKLKAAVRESAGNPDWIATRGKGPHSRFRRKTS